MPPDASRSGAQRELRRAVENAKRRVVVYTAATGAERSALLHALAIELEPLFQTVFVHHPKLPPGGMWMWLAGELDLDAGYDSKRRVQHAAAELARSGRALVIAIEEAASLPAETLYALIDAARAEPGLRVLLSHGENEQLAGPLPEGVASVGVGAPMTPAEDANEDASGPWDEPAAAAPSPRTALPRRAARHALHERWMRAGFAAGGLLVGLGLGSTLASVGWRSHELQPGDEHAADVALPGSGTPPPSPPATPADVAERPAPTPPAARAPAPAPPDADRERDLASVGVASSPRFEKLPDVASSPPSAPAASTFPVASPPPTPPVASPLPDPSALAAAPVAAPTEPAPTPQISPSAGSPQSPPAPPPTANASASAPAETPTAPASPPPAPAHAPVPAPIVSAATPRRRGPLAEGRLHVTSETPVLVEIDGREYGPTPLQQVQLARGEHRVIAKYPDGSVGLKTITLDFDDVAVSFR